MVDGTFVCRVCCHCIHISEKCWKLWIYNRKERHKKTGIFNNTVRLTVRVDQTFLDP